MAKDLISWQGLRYVGFAGYLGWMSAYYGDLEPASSWGGAASNLAIFAVAVGWYWAMGAWYGRRYGSVRRSVPEGVSDLVPWMVALLVTVTALLGAQTLLTLLASLLALLLGGVLVAWLFAVDILTGRSHPHWMAIFLMVMTASIMHQSVTPCEHAAAALSLGFIGFGLAVCCPLDHRKLTRGLDQASGGRQ
jgi:hypothetical protein